MKRPNLLSDQDGERLKDEWRADNAKFNPMLEMISEPLVVNNADWRFYDDLLRRLEDRHVFVTYDRGRRSDGVADSRRAEETGWARGVRDWLRQNE